MTHSFWSGLKPEELKALIKHHQQEIDGPFKFVVRVDVVVVADDSKQAESIVHNMLHQYPYDTYQYEQYDVTSVEKLAQ